MRITWPCDFEEKAKEPAAVGGAGYPYRISAGDLMDNYKALADMVPDGVEAGALIQWDGFKYRSRKFGNGTLVFKDCAGAEVARIVWENGVILTTGDQIVEGGCDAASGSAS